MRPKHILLVVSALSLLAACGSDGDRAGFAEQNPTEPTEPSPSTPGTVIGNGDVSKNVAVTISGTVYAPNGSLPMANTLVYVTVTEPGPIPEGAYCDTCVALADGTFATSAADGTFTINTELPTGDVWLVVQKGQFRRVRKMSVEKAGPLAIDDEDVTLPGKSNPSKGDDVPKMAVLKDSMDFDKIDESLKKLGITDFDIMDDRSLLQNEATLMKYHVVFIPCGARVDPELKSSDSIGNLQKFVAAGGKLYVTDWSYEFVRQPFPGFVSWAEETNTLGSAATGKEWDAPASASDTGLGDWLAATGDTAFSVKGNWTTITSVNTTSGLDAKGEPVDIEPKVWVTAEKGGQSYPTTISFENQCGRVLFSTYHTESSFSGTKLLAQEKALLYVLLEVGVCVAPSGGVN